MILFYLVWFHSIWFYFSSIIINKHVKNKKYGNFVSMSSLAGKCTAQKFENFCSSSLWTCLHYMGILRSQNKICDFLVILVWASPFRDMRWKTKLNKDENMYGWWIRIPTLFVWTQMARQKELPLKFTCLYIYIVLLLLLLFSYFSVWGGIQDIDQLC